MLLVTAEEQSMDAPARGQCSVNGVLINDLGGETFKTLRPEAHHFYIRIEVSALA